MEVDRARSVDRQHLAFLRKDLEWKALKTQVNISKVRHQHEIDPKWGRTQEVICEVALAMVERVKLLHPDMEALEIDR